MNLAGISMLVNVAPPERVASRRLTYAGILMPVNVAHGMRRIATLELHERHYTST